MLLTKEMCFLVDILKTSRSIANRTGQKVHRSGGKWQASPGEERVGAGRRGSY